MGNSGSGVKNFFTNDWHSFTDLVSGAGAAIGETFTGVTTGNFDYSTAGRHFRNYGTDVKNMFTGSNQSREGAPPPSAEQVALQNYNRAIDPNATWNKINSGSTAANTTNAVYGSAVGNDNVKPSDLLKISNPSVKMAVAATRGAARGTLNLAGAQADKGAVSTLAPAPLAASSDNTNSAGGTGIATSADVGNTSLATP